MSFISQVAKKYATHNSDTIGNYLFLFPNKRATALFKEHLKHELGNNNTILPELLTIQDFFIKFSSFFVADELTLLMQLHKHYEQLTGITQAFHQFYTWGKLILKDFDEIDKYRVPSQELFAVIKAQKDIDLHFDLESTTENYLAAFYKNINNNKQGSFYEEFTKTWYYLGTLYQEWNNSLNEQQLAYEGKAYRNVLEQLIAKKITLTYSKIVFVGFNAFSTCEEQLLDYLIASYDVDTWWDVDPLFLTNKHHEAGNFLRKYQKKYIGEQHFWCIDSSTKKDITITAVPSNIGQVHYCYPKIDSSKKNCIVLCDENLLNHVIPVFDSNTINITMGFAIKQHAIYSILYSYFEILKKAKPTEQHFYFPKAFLMLFFDSQYIQPLISYAEWKEFISTANNYLSFSEFKRFIGTELMVLFHNIEQQAIYKNFVYLLSIIETPAPEEQIIVSTLKQQLYSIEQHVKHHTISDIRDFGLIFENYIGNSSIAYTTNRNANTQIMGFLETRLLDFDNLYILSLNDALLPGTNKTNSFIPYNLRKHFGMPTFEQFDGINAYHFYRLLKRANTIHLIYSNASDDNIQEPSRFISQLLYEYNKTTTTINQHTIAIKTSENQTQETAPMRISKTPEVLQKLVKIKFSVTSLGSYLNCPIQFYLKYILRVKEPEIGTLNTEAALFGSIFHKAMELYYLKQDYYKQQINKLITDAAQQANAHQDYFSGKRALEATVLKELVTTIIAFDNKEDFNVMHLESAFERKIIIANNIELTIYGKIDRVDLLDKTVRIIDYKTGGSIKLLEFPDEEKDIPFFLEELFTQTSEYKETFQGLLYAWLIQAIYPRHAILMSYYLTQKLNSGITYLNKGNPISSSLLHQFEGRLRLLLNEICDTTTPFIKNPDENSNLYSVYNELLLI